MAIMHDARSSLIRHAVILAAGNGDRFRNGSPHSTQSKLLTPVAGTPLLIRTLRSAWEAGIAEAHLVLGYDADRVRALSVSGAPRGLTLHFHLNRNWHEENGLSVLAARAGVDGRSFALLMGDHIFEPRALHHLLRAPRHEEEALLCVDTQPAPPDVASEATKVRLVDGHVIAIGKTIEPYDALDTGLFICPPSVFDAIEASCADGDTTLSGGIRRLAARGLVRGVDVGPTRWWDIDTLDDLGMAEQLVGRTHAAGV
jgi:choline kinase